MFKKQRKYALILYGLSILFIGIAIAVLWNNLLEHGPSFSFLEITIFFLPFISVSLFFILFFLTTKEDTFDSYTTAKVEEAKKEFLSSLEKDKKDEEDKAKEELLKIQFEEKCQAIIPKTESKSLDLYVRSYIESLSKHIELCKAIYYAPEKDDSKYTFIVGYALNEDELPSGFNFGENLNGQVAKSKEAIELDEIPDDYFEIESGLGQAKPKYILILPAVHNNKTIGVLEIATFKSLQDYEKKILHKTLEDISSILNKLVQKRK